MVERSLQADYSAVASKYDADRAIYPSLDHDLAGVITSTLARLKAAEVPAQIADVGCGTGTFLQRFLAGPGQGWCAFGLDRSPEMLGQAQRKLWSSRLCVSMAENLPLRSESLGLVVSTFAFHHFGNVASFLAEAYRVLVPRGRIILRNILPRDGPEPLLYRFFPAAREVDSRRFPLRSQLLIEMEKAGLHLEEERYSESVHRQSAEEFLRVCKNRTVSQLMLLTEEEYEFGLASVKRWAEENPGKDLVERTGLHTFVAQRPVPPPAKGQSRPPVIEALEEAAMAAGLPDNLIPPDDPEEGPSQPGDEPDPDPEPAAPDDDRR